MIQWGTFVAQRAIFLAALDAERHEAAGKAVDLDAELEPRQPEVAVGVDERVLDAATHNGLVEQLPEGVFAGDGHILPGHASGDGLLERRFVRGRPERVGQLEYLFVAHGGIPCRVQSKNGFRLERHKDDGVDGRGLAVRRAHLVLHHGVVVHRIAGLQRESVVAVD